MKHYSTYQSQFIEMFGNGNWEQKCLGEVGTFKRGGGFQKSDYVEHGIPCIHYGQIHTTLGPFIYSHLTEISSDLEPKTKFASKGDLIIAITSEDKEGSCRRSVTCRIGSKRAKINWVSFMNFLRSRPSAMRWKTASWC